MASSSPANIGLPPRDAIQAQLARRSLADFVRLSWHVLEPSTPLVWNWHIEAVCAHVQALLEGRIAERNLVINVPPGSMKSRIVSVCAPAWWWIDHPSWRGIFASGNPKVALRDSVYCRTLIESDWYQRTFRPAWRLAADQNAKGHYVNTAGGFRMAISAGARITGDRADGLFIDDPLDAADANSVAARESCIEWYDQAFGNRLNDLTKGTRCLIMQRLHEGDLAGHVLASGVWAHLCIKQEYEPGGLESPIGWLDPRSDEGALMDPVRFPADVIAQEKVRLGSAGYAGQHQQRPSAAEGTMFKRVYWRWHKTLLNAALMSLPDLLALLEIQRVVIGVDTAMTAKTSGDYTAIFALGVSQKRYYGLDLWKQQVEFPEAKKAIVMMAAKWNASAVVIEGGGSHSGKIAAQELRRETRLPIVEIPNTTDKVVRANGILPLVEAQAVSLPEDAAWASDFVDSLAAFPRALHDDDVDAFCIALEYASKGGGGMAIFEYMRQEAARLKAAQQPAAA